MQAAQALNAQLEEAKTVIGAAAEDNGAYHLILTNPDLLANYVTEFYGPNGPYPTETARDRLAAEVQANSGGQMAAPRPAFQRPQLDMPAPGVQGRSGEDFWATFSALGQSRPEELWKLLSQATPDDLRSRVLISEG